MNGAGALPDSLSGAVNYDPFSGVMVWAHSRGGVARGSEVGSLTPQGYLRFQFCGRGLLVHRVAFWLMTGDYPPIVDHADGNTLNNRLANLRDADPSQSSANRKHRHGATLPKGVARITRSSRFEARITFRGVRHCLGCFDTPDEAHSAYVAASRELHGEFARVA